MDWVLIRILVISGKIRIILKIKKWYLLNLLLNAQHLRVEEHKQKLSIDLTTLLSI